MFCINCSSSSTQVSNSRPSKKSPSIWRRRTCLQCHNAFTTYELPSLAENKVVILADGTNDKFNLGRLILSISTAFSHDIRKAQYDSLPLAQTVESKLVISREPLSPTLIVETVYETLKRFDELAAIQYAARHHLITNVRRRGRPSLASPGLSKPS